jgi:aminoglycoside phosphotransferase (APT) family kinase protein
MTPSPEHAAAIAAQFTNVRVANVARFTTGLAHFVYDVECADGCKLVVRMGRSNDHVTFDAAEYWSKLLRPLAIPLPTLYARGDYSGLPYLLLERLPGRDLHDEYPSLSADAKRRLARQVVEIQRVVGTLPSGCGYGFARHLDGPYWASTWPGFLHQLLDRSRRQIRAAGVVDTRVIERVAHALDRDRAVLELVAPTPFLDDVTTKNVIVDAGRLSGIVDVDALCFGDPLLTIALTQMALLSAARSTDYVEMWCDLVALTAEQRKTLRLYTAVHCVGFLSEQGQAFNHDTPPVMESTHVARLYTILDALLTR